MPEMQKLEKKLDWKFTVIDQILEFVPRILIAIAILLVAWVISSIAARIVDRLCQTLDAGLPNLFRTVIRTAIIITGITFSAAELGINISILATGLGLSGFAIGFALKDALSNLLSGVLLLLYKPFKVGDVVEISGDKAKIAMIDLRYTTLIKEHDGKIDRILVPNSKVFTQTITVFDEDPAVLEAMKKENDERMEVT